jgi:hypothetical protein
MSDTMTDTKKTDKIENAEWHDDQFVDDVKNIVKPSVLDDVRAMVSGQKKWRTTATVFETLGRASTAIASVLAFASASEMVGGAGPPLAFSAGSVGTLGLVLSSFANFARTQSIERNEALNLLLQRIDLESVPDVNETLDINDGD